MEQYIFNYALIEDGKIKLDYFYQNKNIFRCFNTPNDLLAFEELDKITNPQDLVEYFTLEFNKL